MLSKSVTGFAGLFYAEQYRVAIAVKTHADQALDVPGRLAFFPITLSASRIVSHRAIFEGFFNSAAIHPSQHNDAVQRP